MNSTNPHHPHAPRLFRITRLMLAALALLAMIPGAVLAQSTWNGGGGDNNWGTGANWGGSAPTPGTTTDLQFGGSTRLAPLNNYTAFDDFRNVLFLSGAGTFSITGAAVDLYGKLENQSSNPQTFNLAIGTGTASASFIEIDPTSGDLAVGGSDVFMGNNQMRIYGNNAKTLTFGASTIISGSGAGNSLALNQNSTVIFQSAHTYSGDTFLNAGTLQINSAGSANSSTIRIGDTAGTVAATLSLGSGASISSTLVIRTGSSGTKSIASTATSGTATSSGSGVFMDADLTTSSASGGTVAFSGTAFDLKNQTLTVSGAGNTTISGVLQNSTGTGKLTKTGTGTLTLTKASTATGATTLSSGTTLLDFAATGAPTANIINSGSALTLGGANGGGLLTLNGKSATANTQTFPSLAIGTGAGKFTLTPGTSGGTVAMTITAALPSAASLNTVHGALQFSGAGTTTLSGNLSAANFANGQGNLYGTYGTDNYAATSAGGVVQASALTAAPSAFANGVINNVTGSFTANSSVLNPTGIRFADATGRTVTQNNAAFFAGGILVASTAGASAIAGTGTIRPFGSTSVPTDFQVIQNSANDFTINNAILNNSGARLASLVKSGTGKLIFTGANGNTGGTYINEGTVQVGSGSTTGALGTGGIVNFAALIFNRSDTALSDANAISGSGSVSQNGSGKTTLTGYGSFTGDVNVNSGNLTASGANNFVNPTTSTLGNPQAARNFNVNSGGTLTFATGDTLGGADTVVVATLVIASGGTANNVAGSFNTLGPVTLNGGTLTGTGGATAGYQMFNLRGTVTVGGSSASTISGSGSFPGYHLAAPTTFNVADVTSGTDLTVSGVLTNQDATHTGAGSLTKSGAGTMVLSGANTYSGTTTISAGVLQVGAGSTTGTIGTNNISNNASLVFNRFDAVTNSSVISGTGTLTNLGAGALTLSGASTYSGNTIISAGTLKAANTTGSATGSGNVTVASGATLGGGNTAQTQGFISGLVTVNSGGILAPGSSVGTLTVGLLTLSSGATNNYEFNGTTNDQTVVTTSGGLTINGGTFNLYTEGGTTPWTTPGAYNLIQYSGSFAGLDSTWTTVSGSNPHIANPQAGYLYQFGTSGGWVKLTITASVAVGTWGVDADGNWSVAGNWTGSGILPPQSPGDSATFGTGTSFRTVTLDAGKTVGSITMNNANSFAITGSQVLTLDNSGSGVNAVVTAGTTNSIQTPVSLNDNLTAAVSSGKSLTLSGVVSNLSAAKTVTVNGAGTVALSGNNSYGPAAGTVGTTLGGGGTLQVGHNSALGAGDVAVSSSSTFKSGAASLSVVNNMAVGPGATATVDRNGNSLSLAGVISGSGRVAAAGGGTLTLTNNNTFTGGTTNSTGTLVLSGNNNFGAGGIGIGGGTVTLSGANTYSGATTLGGGTLNVNNASALGTSTLTIAGGALDNSSGGAISNANNNAQNWNSDFTFTGTQSLNLGTGAVTPSASRQVTVSANTLTVGGVIGGGAISLTKLGSGTLALGGANTFSGGTTLSVGTLNLANQNALQSSALTMNGGTLVFDSSVSGNAFSVGGLVASTSGVGYDIALQNNAGSPAAIALTVNSSANTTYAAILSGGGSLTKAGSGTLILTASNSYSGSTTVGGGVLQLNTGGAIGGGAANVSAVVGAKLLVSGGTLAATSGSIGYGSVGLAVTSGSATYTNDVTMGHGAANGNLIAVTGGSLTVSNLLLGRTGLSATSQPGSGSTTDGLYVNGGAVTVNGQFSMSINSLDNSSVNTRIDSGSLTVGGAAIIGLNNNGRWSTLDVNGGTLTVNDTATGVSVGGPFAGNALLLVRAGTATVGKIGLGYGTVADTAVLNLTGGSLYVGSGGIVQVSANVTPTITLNGGTLGAMADWSSSLAMTLGGSTIQAADAASTARNISLSGVLSGTTLTKTGNGTLTLSGTNTYSGATTISAGTLLVNGSLGGSGAVAVSSGATLGGTGGINGIVTINGTLAPGTSIGTLTLSNSPTLNGTTLMEVNSTNSPANSDNLTLTSGALNYGGALVVTNLGPAPTNGTTFTLFTSGGGYGSGFASVTLPTGNTTHWKTNNLLVDGTIVFTNSTPVAGTKTYSVAQGGVITITVASGSKSLASDADGDTLAVTDIGGTNAVDYGTAVISGGGASITYTNTSGSAGSFDTFSYTVSDGFGGLATNAISVRLDSAQGFNQISAANLGGNTLAFSYLGIPGTNYALDWATNLSAPINWMPVVTNAAQTNGWLYFTNTGIGTDFYRTRYAP